MKIISLHEKYERDHGNLIKEELDQADLQNIARAFDKIDGILGNLDSKLPSIDEPIEKARQDLSNMLGGEGGLLKRMFRGITGQQQKTIQGVMEAQIQLVSLFRALPSIMTLAGKQLKQKIAGAPDGDVRAVRAGEPADPFTGLVKANTVVDAINDPRALKNLQILIIKALKPSSVKSTPIDPKRVAQELVALTPEEFGMLAHRAGGAQIRVPVPKEDLESLQVSTQGLEGKESGGRAQQLISDLTRGDKDRAKVMKTLIDQLSGLTGQDIGLVKKGLDRFLKSPPPIPA